MRTKKTEATESVVVSETGLIHPKVDPHFVLESRVKSLFDLLPLEMQATGQATHTLLIGPSGCGKTETAKQFAAHQDLPYMRLNMSLFKEARDLFGRREIINGETVWEWSSTAMNLERGHLVLIMDELPRAQPGVNNAVFGLLDLERATYVEEARHLLRLGENVYIFATANIGSEYTDSNILDRALRSRFGYDLEVHYLPAAKEKELLVRRTGIAEAKAASLVTFANKVRESKTLGASIDTRRLLSVAKAYAVVGPSCVDFTVSAMFDDEGGSSSDRAQVLQVWQGQNLHIA